MPHLPRTAFPLVAIVVCLILGVGWYLFSGEQGGHSSSPRSAALDDGGGPYVDDAVCADCHARQARGLAKTGHANTFRTAIESNVARGIGGRAFEDPERGYSYHYHFDESAGLSVSIPEQFGADRFPLSFELGSGHNAVTFLTLIPSRLGDTMGIEHRVSLYPSEAGWELDLTPGHKAAATIQDVEHFGKVIRGDTLTRCIGCHTTSAEIAGQGIRNLRPHVGCQNCHGPGREHVIAMEKGGKGPYAGFTDQSAIVEIQLCGRCHRLPNAGADAKVEPDDIQTVRFQSVGLLQSRCFQRSEDGLKCSTCHDPHEPVVRDASHYVRKCLECHGQNGTANCSVSAQTGCVECHMPPIDIHRGIKFHDHWIRVRHDAALGSPAP